MKQTNPASKALVNYQLTFWASIVVYVGVLFASISFLKHAPTGPLLYVAAIAPMVPLAGVFAAVTRYLMQSDEFVRQTTVTSLAVAGGITAMFVLTCGFLENAGLPRVSMWIIWMVYALSFGAAACVVRKYYA